jgi:hypothetical protein
MKRNGSLSAILSLSVANVGRCSMAYSLPLNGSPGTIIRCHQARHEKDYAMLLSTVFVLRPLAESTLPLTQGNAIHA